MDRVGFLDKHLDAAGKRFEGRDSYSTTGSSAQYAATRDLIRELSKFRHEAIAKVVAKELKTLESKSGYIFAPNNRAQKSFTTKLNQKKGA